MPVARCADVGAGRAAIRPGIHHAVL
jgi:hypothetical protein